MAPRVEAAGQFKLDDGLAGTDGHLEATVDEYGSFGVAFPNNVFDLFQAPVVGTGYPTYLAGVFLFVTTPGKVSSVLLSEFDLWFGYLEAPPNEDGLVGNHTNLARTITQGIAGSGPQVASKFDVTATEFTLQFSLSQTITTDVSTATSQLAQVYTIKNAGSTAVDLVFHAASEPDLFYGQGAGNSFTDDVVGIGPGLCAPYVHNPGSTTVAVAMSSGPGTTLPTRPLYYAGKQDDTQPLPGGTGDPFRALSAVDSEQFVWLRHGMPANWQNYVVGPGYTMDGNSGTVVGDATMGLEWRFTLAAGATETIDVRRYYGTIAVSCPTTNTMCGNGVVDTANGEPCDGADTETCNGATCMVNTCGDGYPNQLAGEECDSSAADSDVCNGAMCTLAACGDGYKNEAAGEMCDEGGETASCTAACLPSTCGDGYVNAAAGEQCDGGELCDSATCELTFSVGGGCAGCGTGGDDPRSLWLVAAFGVIAVRRRRARRA